MPEAARPDSLSSGFITSLYTDRQQRLWVGTYGGGISILESSAEPLRFRHMGKAQGMPDENINSLLEDRSGHVWASTDNGLARIDPATFKAQGLRRAEGVEFLTYWTGSAAHTSAGELLFGGAGGMSIVRPEQFKAWTYKPPVVLTALRLGTQWLDQPQLAALPPEALEIPSDANSLAAEFAALDFSAPERNRYAYKLEGLDKQWMELDVGQRQLSYNNLPPGHYKLLLRGANRDGAWTEKELSLPLRVLPAWHQTWWFRVLAALLTVTGVVAVVQMRTRWLRQREQQLKHLVAERTAELERLSLALAEKSRVLERASISDPLTGLHNRRFLTEHIDTALAASLPARARGQAARERAAARLRHLVLPDRRRSLQARQRPVRPCRRRRRAGAVRPPPAAADARVGLCGGAGVAKSSWPWPATPTGAVRLNWPSASAASWPTRRSSSTTAASFASAAR